MGGTRGDTAEKKINVEGYTEIKETFAVTPSVNPFI